jgi:hypothetical protein
MDSADREPCPFCGEIVPLATIACPFCKTSLKVDVVLAAPVEDERIRYQLARAIASLGPPAPDFSTVQRALEDPRPVLARGLSKLAARRLVEALKDFGVAAASETAGTVAPQSPSGARRLATWAALGVVMAGTVFVVTRREPPPAASPAAPAQRTASLAQTRSIPWSTPSPPLSLKDLSVLAAPATVEIRCGDRRSAGFFVARDVVLTRTAATEGCADVEVVTGSATLEGEIAQRDSRLGLAVVRATGSGAEPLRLGDAASLHSGDPIFLAGSTVREGRMGMAARQLHGIAFLPIAGDVQPGDAGAPVLDGHGFVVGLIAGREEGGEPFLLPINYAYEESHLLEKPSPAPDPRKWKTLLAEVELAERLRVEPSPDSSQPPSTSSPSTQ